MDMLIERWMIEEAERYAILSACHTSDRHDFHRGGIAAKAEKMFEGKLGEKVFKAWLRQQGIPFDEDHTSHEEADLYDFRVGDRTIDVKTCTKDVHRRLLEMVEQYAKNAKDYYVAVRLRFTGFTVSASRSGVVFDFTNTRQGPATIVGWASKDEIGQAEIENVGYGDNYRLWLRNLRDIDSLAVTLRSRLRPPGETPGTRGRDRRECSER